MTASPTAQPSDIVDLVAISEAAQPLAGWWRRLLDLGQPGLQRLDYARQALDALGPVPGRLGRAIDLVVRCDDATVDSDMAAAIAMLVQLADRPQPPGPADPSQPSTARRPNHMRAARGQQLQLPLGQTAS